MNTKNSIKEIAISIVAPVVKMFPSWAMKHTLRVNDYADYFQLSHKKEMEILSKLPQSEWVKARLWSPETRIACLKSRDKYHYFLDEIFSSKEFWAAYNNELTRERAVRCKTYTLSGSEVIKVCNETCGFVDLLWYKQPHSFTAEVVSKLSTEAVGRLIIFLNADKAYEIAAKLDMLLLQNIKKAKRNAEGAAKVLSMLLMDYTAYYPSIEPEELMKLEGFNQWLAKADIMVVTDKLSTYLKNLGRYDLLLQLLVRALKKRQFGIEKDIFSLLPKSCNCYQTAVTKMVEAGIAMPKDFAFLSDDKIKEQNLKLCQIDHRLDMIPEMDYKYLSENQKEWLLYSLARAGKLSQHLLDTASPKVKQNLLDILEEEAQVAWFKELVVLEQNGRKYENIQTVKNLAHISARLQAATLSFAGWQYVFAENGFYDSEYSLELLKRGTEEAVKIFAEKQGLTAEQYEALLIGNNKALAPELRRYIKKNV